MDLIEEILAEAEEKEAMQLEVFMDLQLNQIGKLQKEMENNFQNAEKEIELINNWVMKKNSSLQERVTVIEKQLEQFIRETEKKTIDLPNGTLKIRKQPDKAVVENMELFLEKANKELVTIVPETIKPNLNAIKSFIKRAAKVPEGIKIVEGKEEFSYAIKKEEDNAGKKEAGVGIKQAGDYRAAV
ncbi:MAG: host-nuclease inhibitor Gam family protein [Melioribacteraceae bacterium]|nr:host-nuclease inhibitor Gam family protein [Melioribacteraceae bacterium]MCF8395710.1 host-nuclease inhibitor Gam family protein [Melioribacteraceae bacterium]MCF8421218.1 host-nuclease inhibitor Gam family protein [Melioribacteraceae bacterium]